jgi:hypothetical protein
MLLSIQDAPCAGIWLLAVPCLALWLRAMGFLVSYWKIQYFSTISPLFGTGNELEVSPTLLCAQALETLRMWGYVSSLLDQGSEAAGDLSLLGNTDPGHLLGFLSGGGTAEGGQALCSDSGSSQLGMRLALSSCPGSFCIWSQDS